LGSPLEGNPGSEFFRKTTPFEKPPQAFHLKIIWRPPMGLRPLNCKRARFCFIPEKIMPDICPRPPVSARQFTDRLVRMKEPLHVFKIGGHVLDDEASLRQFVAAFAEVEGRKILVHGGGKGASELLKSLGIAPQIVQGRRITDAATLDVVTMFYAGKTNKQLVALLQAAGVPALGLSGADGNAIQASRRPVGEVDYGFVGDLTDASVNVGFFQGLLRLNLVPVCCAITHDGAGQLLNTNADTIASVVARALAERYAVTLHFCFEKDGVLADATDEQSVIPRIAPADYEQLKASGVVSAGMVPKLDNAFAALAAGVEEVVIENALKINEPIKTVLCQS
jgi:acetylglutamate kinase